LIPLFNDYLKLLAKRKVLIERDIHIIKTQKCKPLSCNNLISLVFLEICRLVHETLILKASIYFKGINLNYIKSILIRILFNIIFHLFVLL